MKKTLPVTCPSCSKKLKVQRLNCIHCETSIEGNYDLDVVNYLSAGDQQFLLRFVKSSGSLKEMAATMKLSYPSVRNMLDDLIQRITVIEKELNQNTSI